MSAEVERHRRLKDAFARAADLTVPARHELIAELQATDPDIAARLVQLLAADAKSGDFLDHDAFGGGDAAAVVPPREVAGERGYRLLRPIGAGGMGTVHLAERADGAFRQQVAIKLLHPLLATSADAAGRFRAERQILADLHHPDITRLLDGGTTADGRPFLVMEYVEGEPLDRHADRLPLADRLRLFLRVCRAVDFAHERGIVHRDLKPGNVLVTAGGEPKLLDFGVAKLLEPLPDRTRHETALGHAPLTLLYASPEQVRGEAVTRASDVYSLGVILYRLVTGALPYGEDETPHGLALAICEREPERPSHTTRRRTAEKQPTTSRQPLAGRDLDAIVLRALRKEPESRYATAGALADDVDRLLAGLPVTARRGTAAYRAGKLVRRHSWRFALAATAFVAVAATAWLTRRLVDPPPLLARGETGRVAVLPFRNETGSASYAWVEAGLSELVGQQLDEAARVEVVAPSDVRRALRDLALAPAAFDDPAALGRLRAALGADFTLAAQVRASGPGELRIDYVLRGDDDGAARARELRGSEATALARELAGRVARRLGSDSKLATAAAGDRLADDATANTVYAMGIEELARGNGKEAEHYFRVALHRAPDLGWARLMLARSLMTMSSWDEAEATLDETLRRARAAGDARLAGEALASLAGNAASRGDPETARRRNAEALQVLRGAGHRKGVANVLNNLGRLAWQRGDLDEAESHYRASLALLEEIGEPQGQAARLNNLGLIAAGRKDAAAAQRLYQQALRRAEASGDRRLQSTVLGNLGLAALHRGDLAAAADANERARALAMALADPASEAIALLNLAVVAQRRGKVAEAEELVRRAGARARAAANPRLEGFAKANLAFLLVARGEDAAAIEAARAARERGAQVEDSSLRFLAALNLAWAQAWSGELTAAAESLHEAATIDAADSGVLRVGALIAYRRGELAAAVAGQERAKAVAPALWEPAHEELLALFRAAAARGRPLPLPPRTKRAS